MLCMRSWPASVRVERWRWVFRCLSSTNGSIEVYTYSPYFGEWRTGRSAWGFNRSMIDRVNERYVDLEVSRIAQHGAAGLSLLRIPS